jgi:trimeric autotransporter adhesin
VGIKVGSLEIEMLANMARLQKDMQEAKATVGKAMGDIERAVGQAKAALGGLGIALGAGAFVAMAKGSIDAMDHLNDLSKATKVTVEDLAGLKLASKNSGADLDSVGASINKLAQNMGKSEEKFKSLGITAKDPLKAFMQLSDVFKDIDDPQTRAAFGAAALGKKWEGTAALLSEGSKKIAEMIERGKELYGVTGEMASRADEFNDRLGELTIAMEGAKAKMVSEMLPALTDIIKAMTEAHQEGGKLKAMWVGLGGIGSMIFTDDSLTPLQKLNKEINQLEAEYRNLDKMKSNVGPVDKLFGFDNDLSTSIGRTTAQLADLRQERTKLLEVEKQSAAQQKIANEAKKAADAIAGTKATQKAKAFLNADEAAKSAGAYKNELASLTKQYASLRGQGELEAYQLKLEEESFKGLSSEMKENLTIMMELIVEEKHRLAANEAMAKSDLARADALEALRAIEMDQTISLRESLQAMAFENALIGQSGDAIARATALRAIDLQLRQALVGVEGDQAARMMAEAEAAKIQAASLLAVGDVLRDNEKAMSGFADSASKYFGTLGASIGGVIKSLVDLGKQQEELAKKREAIAKDPTLDPQKRADLEQALTKQTTQAQLKSYGDIAEAASGLFGKSTRGYKALQAASQVFHAAELAMTIAELVPKAISAILTQGQGDAYSAFFRIAAMTAIVAGLGVAVGGGGGGASVSAAARQREQGTGTVLGDPLAKSASIEKSIEMLSKNSIIGNEHTAGMLSELKSLNRNFAGLAQIVARPGTLGGQDSAALGGFGSRSTLSNIFLRAVTSIVDQGFRINPQTIGSARQNFSGATYSTAQQTTSFLGIRTGTRTVNSFGTLSQEVNDQFTLIINNLFNTILGAARVFGSNIDEVSNVLNAFNINLQDISLKGLKPDEIQAQLTAVFSALGDNLARAAFPALAEFQQVGEGMLQTLVRLAQEFAATNAILEILGKDVATAFGAVGIESIKARDHLVQLFGGIEEMSNVVQKFFDLFYTDGEKLDRSLSTLKYQFEQLGVAMPTSIAEFRLLVEAQDLSTSAGRTMFAALLQIAPAFQSVTNATASMVSTMQGLLGQIYGGAYARQIAQSAFDQAANAWNAAIGNSGYLAAQTLQDLRDHPEYAQAVPGMVARGELTAAQGDMFNNLLRAFQTLQQALNGDGGAGGGGITPAINTFTDALAEAARRAQALAEAQKSLADQLRGSLLSDLSPLTVREQYNEARSQLDRQIGLAQGGDLNAYSQVFGSFNAFLELSRQINGSNGQYNQDYLGYFDRLNTLSGSQVTRPFTAADAKANSDAMVAEIKESRLSQARTTDAVVALANTVIEIAQTGDPVVRAKLQEQVDALNKIANRGGALSSEPAKI